MNDWPENTLNKLMTQPLDVIGRFIECVKDKVDETRSNEVAEAHSYSDFIIRVGSELIERSGDLSPPACEETYREGVRIVALGLMTKGDTYAHVKEPKKAWSFLDKAGKCYLSIDDSVGWARTRIGRLLVCADIDKIDQGRLEAEEAYTILKANSQYEMLVKLRLNFGAHYDRLMQYDQALKAYIVAEMYANKCLNQHKRYNIYLAKITGNKANCYYYMGDIAEAINATIQSIESFEKNNAKLSTIDAKHNLAFLHRQQGQYQTVLDIYKNLLQEIEDLIANTDDKKEKKAYTSRLADTYQGLGECYLDLNRFSKASHYLSRALSIFEANNQNTELTSTYTNLAKAELNLGEFQRAKQSLDKAEAVATIDTWLGNIYLDKALLARRNEELEPSLKYIQRAHDKFKEIDRQDLLARAQVEWANILVAHHDYEQAITKAQEALSHSNLSPLIEFDANTILGMAMVHHKSADDGRQYFEQAWHIIEKLQQELSLLLRGNFLKNRQIPIQELMKYHIQANRFNEAFSILEQGKAQIWQSYALDHNLLKWNTSSETNQKLVDELDEERRKRQFNEAMLPEIRDKIQKAKQEFERTEANLADHEREFKKDIIENLQRILRDRKAQIDQLNKSISTKIDFLSNVSESENLQFIHKLSEEVDGDGEVNNKDTGNSTIATIQKTLSPDTLLVEYYYDGETWGAFIIDGETTHHIPLGVPETKLEDILEILRAKLGAVPALFEDLEADPEKLAYELEESADDCKTDLQKLYEFLVQPLEEEHLAKKKYDQVFFVPYGALHGVPFNLLHNQRTNQYLIEQYQIATLPSANLLLREPKTKDNTVLCIAYEEGNDRYVYEQANIVAGNWDTQPITKGDAIRSVLDTQAGKVLHIIAHGEFFPENPELSYLQLKDGKLYLYDVWQYDVSYELVVLSVCEIGQSNIYPGNEIIGLGSSFLYKGAQSLIMSLWEVQSGLTKPLMEAFYQVLFADSTISKAKALQLIQKQCAQDNVHPAIWGAFQLIGDPGPLNLIRKGQQNHGK